jgi:hypothetical protein
VNGIAHVRFACALSMVFTLHVWYVPALRAQAWVPDRGDGTISFTYQNYDVAGHFDVLGRENTNGGTRSHVLATEVDYGLTDTLALTVSLPFIASKYTGPPTYFVGPHETHPGPLDDGRYHGAFQDVRVEVRRLFWAGPVPIAPFVGVSFPSHEYETVGEAVPGRYRRDFQFGANAGFNLDRVLPGSYVQGRYSFATAERVNNFAFTRSNIDVEGGYAVMSRVVIRGLMNRQVRHQGPSLDQLAADWEHHDRFIAPSYVNLGGGVSLSVTGSTDVYALLVTTISGNNGAHRARTVAVGITLGLGSSLQGLGGVGTASPSISGSRRLMRPSR